MYDIPLKLSKSPYIHVYIFFEKILDKIEDFKKNNNIYITQLNEKKHSFQLNFFTINQENLKKINF